jgi:hypothetical protein
MNDNNQLLNIFKFFSDVIKDLNITFNTLSQTLNILSSKQDNLLKKEDLTNILKILEQSIAIDLTEKIKSLELCLYENNKELMEKLNELNNKSTLQNILELDVKKKQFETEQKIIESNNEVKVIDKKINFKKLKKIIGFLIIVGVGSVSFIKYLIPYIIQYWVGIK